MSRLHHLLIVHLCGHCQVRIRLNAVTLSFIHASLSFSSYISIVISIIQVPYSAHPLSFVTSFLYFLKCLVYILPGKYSFYTHTHIIHKGTTTSSDQATRQTKQRRGAAQREQGGTQGVIEAIANSQCKPFQEETGEQKGHSFISQQGIPRAATNVAPSKI